MIDLVPTATRVLGLKPSPWWNGRFISEAFPDASMEMEMDCPSERKGFQFCQVSIMCLRVIFRDN